MTKQARTSTKQNQNYKPATTIEGRENQMIALADRLAEQKLRDGTASSQLIVHYVKLGSTKERIEKEILTSQRDLNAAKIEDIKGRKKTEELYANALAAMRSYSSSSFSQDDSLEDEDYEG